MTAGELIEMLQEVDPDTEVRWAAQPSWPFEYSISEARIIEIDEEIAEGDASLRKLVAKGADLPENIIYLVEGRQLGYLPGYVSREIGWR